MLIRQLFFFASLHISHVSINIRSGLEKVLHLQGRLSFSWKRELEMHTAVTDCKFLLSFSSRKNIKAERWRWVYLNRCIEFQLAGICKRNPLCCWKTKMLSTTTVAGFGCKFIFNETRKVVVNFFADWKRNFYDARPKWWRISKRMSPFNYCVSWNQEIGRQKTRPHVFASPGRPLDRLIPRRGRRPKFARDGKKLISELQVAGADEKCVDAGDQNGLLIGTIKKIVAIVMSCKLAVQIESKFVFSALNWYAKRLNFLSH